MAKRYYKIVEFIPENLKYLNDISGIEYWKVKLAVLEKIARGEMKDNFHIIRRYFINHYNKILREKGVNVRVI